MGQAIEEQCYVAQAFRAGEISRSRKNADALGDIGTRFGAMDPLERQRFGQPFLVARHRTMTAPVVSGGALRFTGRLLVRSASIRSLGKQRS
jgi:hypothetical protein